MSTDSSAPTSLGWYGKLPSAGDFLQRRLPDPVVNNWAHWFHNGLVNLQRDAQGQTATRSATHRCGTS